LVVMKKTPEKNGKRSMPDGQKPRRKGEGGVIGSSRRERKRDRITMTKKKSAKEGLGRELGGGRKGKE